MIPLDPTVMVPLDTLFLEAPGFTNPRTESDLDEASIAELAADIARRGLRSPLTAWEIDDDCRVVISGQRRLLALQRLARDGKWGAYEERPEVPVRVFRARTLDEARVEALADNVHRAPLSSYETAVALTELKGTVSEIAERTGISKSNVSLLLTALGGSTEDLRARWKRGELSARAVYDAVRDPGGDPPESRPPTAAEESRSGPNRGPRGRPPTAAVRRLAARAKKARDRRFDRRESPDAYLDGLSDGLTFAAIGEEPDDQRWVQYTGRSGKKRGPKG